MDEIDYKQQIIDRLPDIIPLYTINQVLNVVFPLDYMLEHYTAYPQDAQINDCLNGYYDCPGSISRMVEEETHETGPIWRQFKTSQHGCDWCNFMDRLGVLREPIGKVATSMNGTTVKQLILEQLLHTDGIRVSQLESARIFLERLHYYQPSENHHDDDLWHLAFNGRLARCSYLGEKRWAQTHLECEDIIWDSTMGFYVATREINGEGCSYVRHRPLLASIGADWNSDIVNKIEEYFDGGSDCKMIIDQDFATAYEPTYDDNDSVLGKDLVCGYSCMSGRGDDAQSFYGSIEGCSIVRFENGDGEQVGRCIMYEYRGIRHFIRLYAKKEYQNRAYAMIKAEMRDCDIFGRDEYISGLKLRADFDSNTSNMYLDGNRYGLSKIDSDLYITDEPEIRLCETDEGTLFEAVGIIECEQCGEVILDSSEGIRIYDNWGDAHWYCDETCAENDGWTRCNHCDEWVLADNCIDIDGYNYCCEDCAQSAGFRQCERCGEWIYTDDNEDCLYSLQHYFYCSKDCAESDGLQIDEITGQYTNDYIKTTTGTFVDCRKLIENKDKFTIRVSHKKQTKDEQNETNND